MVVLNICHSFIYYGHIKNVLFRFLSQVKYEIRHDILYFYNQLGTLDFPKSGWQSILKAHCLKRSVVQAANHTQNFIAVTHLHNTAQWEVSIRQSQGEAGCCSCAHFLFRKLVVIQESVVMCYICKAKRVYVYVQ